MLSQFRDAEGRATLASLVKHKGVYAAGRLDFDSEGLLLLTDDGALQARISEARSKLRKTYWVQVEGEPGSADLQRLLDGVRLKDGPAAALAASVIGTPPGLWPRDPPIRYRASVPASWVELCIDEGRNRQVRRMTAAIGFPTLRLIRCRIGPWSVRSLRPGESLSINNEQAWQELKSWHQASD